MSIVVPPVTLPQPLGVHRVGRRSFIWTDAGRNRSFPVWIYYPAWSSKGTDEPTLRDPVWSVLHRGELEAQVGVGPARALGNLTTTAQSDAEVEPSSVPYHVLLFAPARGWLPTDYSALIEEVVSRGYVVVAFAPPGDAAVVRLEDGTVIPLRPAGEGSQQRLVADFRFLTRTLRDNALRSDWQFRGMLDLAHVGIVGHSLGGTAAFLAVGQDSSYVAAASLDGDFPATGRGDAQTQPLLYLSTQPRGLETAPIDQWAALNRGERRRTEMWNALRVTSRWSLRVQVIGMEGGNFLDAALMPPQVTMALDGPVSFGAIGGQRGIVLTARLLDSFFGVAFNGSPTSVFAATAEFPEARISY